MLTRAESTTRRPEAACVDVRAGEQYWVLLENWTARSTAYQLSQSISATQGECGTLPFNPMDTTSGGGVDKGGIEAAHQAVPLN